MKDDFTPEYAKAAETENLKWDEKLAPVPKDQWPKMLLDAKEIWRSKYFSVVVFQHGPAERINVHRNTVDLAQKTWEGNITWDELMEVKRQCGRGAKDALEWFPRDENIVNDGNFRHLWVFEDKEKLAEFLETFLFQQKINTSGNHAHILTGGNWAL